MYCTCTDCYTDDDREGVAMVTGREHTFNALWFILIQ